MENTVIIDLDKLAINRAIFVNELAMLNNGYIYLDDWFFGMLLCYLQDNVYEEYQGLKLIYPLYIDDDNKAKIVSLNEQQEELDIMFYDYLKNMRENTMSVLELMDLISNNDYQKIVNLASNFNDYMNNINKCKIKQ